MANLKIVIDASVIAKWFLPDEQETEIALKIKEDFVQGSISIALPSLVFYEINNLLNLAVVRLRVSGEKAVDIYRDFLELDFETYFTKELLKSTLENALAYKISSYDASYIALTEMIKAPFFTADEKLINQVKSKYVKTLKDYK